MRRAAKWLGIVAVICALFIPPLYARRIIAGATEEINKLRDMFDE